MQGKFKVEFLGLSSFQGKKDPSKTYYSANLLQGTDVIKVFLQEGQEVLFSGIAKMDEIEVEINIQIREKTYLSILSVMSLENGKPIERPSKASA